MCVALACPPCQLSIEPVDIRVARAAMGHGRTGEMNYTAMRRAPSLMNNPNRTIVQLPDKHLRNVLFSGHRANLSDMLQNTVNFLVAKPFQES